MRTCTLLAALLLCAWTDPGAAATAPEQPPAAPKEKQEVGPMEIDFAPLPGPKDADQYKIHLVVLTANGTKFKDTFTIGRGFTAEDVRDFVKRGVAGAGWTVKALGNTGLVIEGYKDSEIRSVEIKTEGLTTGSEPTVTRVPKKEK
jgi:hypothetical protein